MAEVTAVAGEVCKFCGRPVRSTWRGVTLFVCGSGAHHVKPFTEECWRGFVWKLHERLEALEGVVLKYMPV